MKLLKTVFLFAAAKAAVTDTYTINGDESEEELQNISDVMGGPSTSLIGRSDNDRRMAQLGSQHGTALRKFRTLSILVKWLQPDKDFDKFSRYACHCFPQGKNDISAKGYGHPKDAIDRACFDFQQCYGCLAEEFEGMKSVMTTIDGTKTPTDTCSGKDVGYGVILSKNGDQNVISCKNKVGSCRRSICECDKQLAERFANYYAVWDSNFSQGFNRENECAAASGAGGGAGSYTGDDKTLKGTTECCGGPGDFPYNRPRRADQCCDGHVIRPIGQC